MQLCARFNDNDQDGYIMQYADDCFYDGRKITYAPLTLNGHSIGHQLLALNRDSIPIVPEEQAWMEVDDFCIAFKLEDDELVAYAPFGHGDGSHVTIGHCISLAAGFYYILNLELINGATMLGLVLEPA